MTAKNIPKDQILEKIFDMYMENLPYPDGVEEALNHICSRVDRDTYKDIEDDLSLIMSQYETRAFKIGFSAGLKAANVLSHGCVNE